MGQLKEKEEEPEGEELGDSDTGSSKKKYNNLIFFFFFDPIFIGIICLGLLIKLLPPALSLDELEQEGEKGRPLPREEEDLDIIRSWVEVGGHPARQEGEAKELLAEVNIFPCLSLSSYLICYQFPLTTFCIFDSYMLFPPSLQGLRLLQGASEKREKARRLEVEAEKMEAEGWEKFREAITGSEAEGLYGLLRGVTSSSRHIPSKPPPCRSRLSPGPSASPQPPQESTGPSTSDPVGPATVPAPVDVTPATGGTYRRTCNPFVFSWGALKEFINAG